MQQLTLDDIDTQRCPRCELDLPVDAYHPGKRGKPGNYCKPCCNEYKHERYGTTPRRRRTCWHPDCDRPPSSKGALSCAQHRRPRTRMGYTAAHLRVTEARGRAADQRCSHCQGPADHWAYDHADPDEMQQVHHGRTVAYSTDPAHYLPLCRSCHAHYDRRGKPTQTRAVLRWVAEAGPVRLSELEQRFPGVNVDTIIARAVRRGAVERVARGVYAARFSEALPPGHPLSMENPSPRARP